MTYLRWQRILSFNITSSLCTATAALATWGLVTGYQQKHEVKVKLSGAMLHIQDAFAAGGSVAAGLASILCSFVLGMALFRRNQPETIKSVRIKEVIFGISLLAWTGTLIPATYIWQTHSGVITKPGVPASVINQIIKLGNIDLRYQVNKPLRAQIIVGWVAFASMLITTALVIAEARYVLKHGRDGPLIGHLKEEPAVQETPSSGFHSLFEKRDDSSSV